MAATPAWERFVPTECSGGLGGYPVEAGLGANCELIHTGGCGVVQQCRRGSVVT
jgi:hypothetical protein